jgi:hypothetical protein
MSDTAQEIPVGALSHEEQGYAIKTWRYLRLAMVILVAGLLVSILFEWRKVGYDCIQTSISAYYYTPVHGFLVGSLVGIGICLVCLKGSTEIEDVLLNLAGMFAPIVALVPTPDTGSCASLLGTTADRNLNIANNMTALIAVEVIALALLAGTAIRSRPKRPTIIGYAAAGITFIVTATVFWADRGLFIDHAHGVSATAMFACILLVVAVNAFNFKEVRDASLRNRYTVIAVAMAVATVGLLIALAAGWDYWLIALEGTLISLFAVFWVIQTWELRRVGLR